MKLHKYCDHLGTYYIYGDRKWHGQGCASSAYAYVSKLKLIDHTIKKLRKLGK